MGLLDQFSEFAKTPEGQGLLSAAFGGLAGARRGTPLNNIGRGGLAGLAGYSGAIDRQSQEGEQAFQKQFRQMQMDDMVAKAQKQKGEQEWRGGLPGVMKQAETSYGAGMEGPTMTPGNPKALDQYLMDPRSPFADKLMEQRLMPKASEGFSLTPGGARFDGGGKLIASLPDKPAAAPDAPSKVREFEYAKANGYKGTLADWVAIGPTITAGALAPLRDAQIANIQQENAYNLPPPVQAPRAAGGSVSVSAGGKTYTFPNQAAANQFKKQAGLQ